MAGMENNRFQQDFSRSEKVGFWPIWRGSERYFGKELFMIHDSVYGNENWRDTRI